MPRTARKSSQGTIQTVIRDSSRYAPSKAPYAYEKTGKGHNPTAAHGNSTDTLVKENIVRRQHRIPTNCGCTWGPIDFDVMQSGRRRWELRFWYALCPVGDVSKHA